MSAEAEPIAGPRLDGQVVVIAAGDNPLGIALAGRFRQAGAQVVLESDPRDAAQCHALVGRVVADHGRLDVWVNVAGDAAIGPAEALEPADWEAGLSRMLSGAFYGAQAAGAHMLPQGRGVIVNVASVDAYQANDGRAIHSAASAGLVALTRSLGIEWAGRGVRVVGVAAGLPPDADLAIAAAHARRTPLRRLATPEELAEAVFFLASSEAAFIVGETLRVDGGWTAYHLF